MANNEKAPSPDDLLTERVVSEDLFNGLVPIRTLQTWRQQRRGPTYIKLSRHVFYRRGDVVDYLNRCAVQTEVPPVPAAEVLDVK